MTNFEWCRAICKVDPKELAEWWAAHGNGGATALPISTHRDNYGLAGSKAKKAKSHDRSRWDSWQSSVKS